MPGLLSDAQIDAHVLAENAWEDLLAEADQEQDDEAPDPATVDHISRKHLPDE